MLEFLKALEPYFERFEPNMAEKHWPKTRGFCSCVPLEKTIAQRQDVEMLVKVNRCLFDSVQWALFV